MQISVLGKESLLIGDLKLENVDCTVHLVKSTVSVEIVVHTHVNLYLQLRIANPNVLKAAVVLETKLLMNMGTVYLYLDVHASLMIHFMRQDL